MHGLCSAWAAGRGGCGGGAEVDCREASALCAVRRLSAEVVFTPTLRDGDGVMGTLSQDCAALHPATPATQRARAGGPGPGLFSSPPSGRTESPFPFLPRKESGTATQSFMHLPLPTSLCRLARIPQYVIESRVRAGVPGDQENFGAARQGEVRRKKNGETTMANSLLPPEERHLTPDQVEALDKRRDWATPCW